MPDDLEDEVVDLLAKAEDYCRRVGEVRGEGDVSGGDLRRLLVPAIRDCCRHARDILPVLQRPGMPESMRLIALRQLHRMLGDIKVLMEKAERFPDAPQVGRRNVANKRRSSKAAKGSVKKRRASLDQKQKEEETEAKRLLAKNARRSAWQIARLVQKNLGRKSADTVYKRIKPYVDTFRKRHKH